MIINKPWSYQENIMGEEKAGNYFSILGKDLDWKKYPITIFGKTYMQPRLVAFYADPGLQYTYSKTVLTGTGRNKTLRVIKKVVEEKTGQSFNSVLCNYYRDGNDSMGWHSDNEPTLGLEPVIASYTLGASRKFSMRSKSLSTNGNKEKYDIHLGNDSLLVMYSDAQKHREHCIAKTKKEVGARINLTFRKIIH